MEQPKPLSYFYEHKNGIKLRKISQRDLTLLRELKDESWFGTVNFAILNEDDQERWYQSTFNAKNSLYLIACTGSFDNENPVGLYGFTDFNPYNRTCSFTHSVFKNSRGKGYGKTTLQAGIDFTFEVYNMRRIDTWILENNIAELKTSQSVGFQIEGTARKAVYKCGVYLDCHYLGLLREEWEQTPRVQAFNGVCNTMYRPKDGKSAATSK